jgi:hypothetical protein
MKTISPSSCAVVVITDAKGNTHSQVEDCQRESCPTSAANPDL